MSISNFKRCHVVEVWRRQCRLLNDDVVFIIFATQIRNLTLFIFLGRMKAFIAYHLLYATCTYRFDRFDSRKVILKNKNLILIKHLFVKHMERVERMKRQDNKWSTIYLLSSFLVHHKSVNVPKALSKTKSNATIRTAYSHYRSSKVTGLNTAHGTLQRFFVWNPVNKLSSWQSYAAIQRTATWSPLSFAVISNQTCYYLLLEG